MWWKSFTEIHVDNGDTQRKLKTLFDKIKDAVFVASTEGKFLEINKAGIALFGYESSEEIKAIDFEKPIIPALDAA